MKKKILLSALSLLVFSLTLFMASLEAVNAEACFIVKVRGGSVDDETDVRITPPKLTIEKDTCIIWLNRLRTKEIMVKFEEDGKTCLDKTISPSGFEMAQNCYLTTWMPYGGTSSLVFNQPGTFNYTVEVTGGKKVKGTITVKE